MYHIYQKKKKRLISLGREMEGHLPVPTPQSPAIKKSDNSQNEVHETRSESFLINSM